MRILLAAGQDALHENSLTLLEASGCRLITAPDLRSAMATLFEDPPDLIIVERGFASGGDREILAAAGSSIRRSLMPVVLLSPPEGIADLDWDEYRADELVITPADPVELLSRIRLARTRMTRVFDNNPLSRLPGNTSIIQAIQERLDRGDDFAVCYLDIDNFKPYNDRYGFSRGDEVILMVARLLANTVEEKGGRSGFVGHVGGDDFVFIVEPERCRAVCEKVITDFSMIRNMFLSKQDLAAGGFNGKDRQGRETRFELLSISIAVIPAPPGRFSHYGEVSSAAGQLKHHVKKMTGSNFMIDRRDGYRP